MTFFVSLVDFKQCFQKAMLYLLFTFFLIFFGWQIHGLLNYVSSKVEKMAKNLLARWAVFAFVSPSTAF